MIKVILKGGLGNQMFQYALGKALSIKNETSLLLDISFLKTRPPIKGFTVRDYELYFWGVPEHVTSLLQNDFLDKYFSYALLLAQNKLINKNYFCEKELYTYQEEIFSKGPDLTIEGFWNNYKYFHKYESDIQKAFDINKLYNPKFDETENEIKRSNSVAVHIRRGDYLNTKHEQVYTYLDENYYQKAVNSINERVNKPSYFIFEYDKPGWFEKTIDTHGAQIRTLDEKYTGKKFKSFLRLMSICKHNIVSNSTFAFWGAYLNKNMDKTIVCPQKWMYEYDFETPDTWVSIDNENN